MKKIYTFVLATITAITALAADNEPIVVEDFESAGGEAPSVFNCNTNEIVSDSKGTSFIEVLTGIHGNPGNHVATYHLTPEASGYVQYPGLAVTLSLPTGTTLSDFCAIGFDIYSNVEYKNVTVWVDGERVRPFGNNDILERNHWFSFSTDFDIESDAATVQIGIGLNECNANAGSGFSIDNIRLTPKDGVVIGPDPKTYAPTLNGTMTPGGWLMIEDFQPAQATGIALPVWAAEGETSGTAVTAEDPADETNLAARFIGGNQNTVFEVSLPEGMSVSDYAWFSFRIYRFDGDAEGSDLQVRIDDTPIVSVEHTSAVGRWVERVYWLNRLDMNPRNLMPSRAGEEAESAHKLRIGLLSDNADYMIDDIKFAPNELTGVEELGVDAAECEAGYYTIGGQRVAPGALVPGLYIKIHNGHTSKLLLK